MFIACFLLLFLYSCFRGLTRDVGVAGFMLAIGFMQDPTRKLLPNEPVVMTVMVGVVMACVILRRFMISRQQFMEPFTRWTNTLVTPLTIYFLLVGLQAVHSLARYGVVVVTGLGAIFYIAPFLAIVVGYFQFQGFNEVRRFLIEYCVFAMCVSLTVVASFLGVESELFGEVGSGLIIYDQGTVLKAYSGIMRSSEIASWHMGACVCFLLILIADKSSVPSWLLSAIAITLLIGAIVLTGRRKMLIQIVIFAGLFFPALRFYQDRLSTRFVPILFLAFILGTVFYSFMPSLDGTEYDLYLARGASVFSDAGERFTNLGLGSIGWAIRIHGIFGGGLGVASQGAAHFVQGYISGAGEGGIGKIVSELGLVSLFVLIWLACAVAEYLHRCIRLVARSSPDKLAFVVGVTVFLVANLPTFIVSSQVFGDVFVLLMLGLLAGALFAIPSQVVQRISNKNSSIS